MTTSTVTTPVATSADESRSSAGGGHPLLVALEQLDATSAAMAGHADAWAGLETLTIREACTRIRKIRARLDGQVIAATRALEAAGAASKAGATSTGAMLANDYGGNRRETDALVRTGTSMSRAGAHKTEQELLSGALTPEQAQIISAGLLSLPQDTPEADRVRCEEALLRQAHELPLRDLRRAADRVLEPIAGEAEANARENLTVAGRERRAWAATELSMTPQGDGTTTGRFRVPDACAAMLTTLLQAQSAPRRTHMRDSEAGLDIDQLSNTTYSQRLGQAFCALIEHVPTDGWATSGGTPASIVVTMDLATLRGELNQKVAVLSGEGGTMSAGEARRLACQHGITPHVLGGHSLPLDIGANQRLFSRTLRKALAARDQGCAFPGCDRPHHWCEAHHIQPVSAGGETRLANGVLLCAHHHRFVHQNDWEIRLNAAGDPQFRAPGSSTWRMHSRYRVAQRAMTTAPDPPGRSSGQRPLWDPPPDHSPPQGLPPGQASRQGSQHRKVSGQGSHHQQASQ